MTRSFYINLSMLVFFLESMCIGLLIHINLEMFGQFHICFNLLNFLTFNNTNSFLGLRGRIFEGWDGVKKKPKTKLTMTDQT